MNFFLSWIPTSYLSNFFGFGFLSWRGFEFALNNAIFVYGIISLLIPICVFTYYLNRKFFLTKKPRFRIFKKNSFNLFYYLIIVSISSFLIVAGILNYFTSNLINDFFILYYFNKLFLRFGLIGIIGICLAYHSYKKEKNLFYFLVSSIFLILIISSIFIFKEFFLDSGIISIHEIPETDFINMNYWFNRTWFYIIPFVSIFASIGIYKIGKRIRRFNLFKNFNIDLGLKNLLICLFIFFSISNLLIMGILFGRKEGKINDKEAHIIGWVSENIPINSNILVDRYYFSKSLEQITHCNSFYANDVYEDAFKVKSYWKTLWLYDNSCNISIVNVINGHNNVLKFDDNNNTGNAAIDASIESPQSYGKIDFWIMTSNKSQAYYFYIKGEGEILINLQIHDDYLSYFNGTENVMLYEIKNNFWYNITITFECSEGGYDGLSEYQWNLYVNNTIYNNLPFWKRMSKIDQIKLLTDTTFSNYSVFLDEIIFNWNSEYKMDACVPRDIIIDYLTSYNIEFLLISLEMTFYKSKIPEFFIERELIPSYFNKKLYEYEEIEVYQT